MFAERSEIGDVFLFESGWGRVEGREKRLRQETSFTDPLATSWVQKGSEEEGSARSGVDSSNSESGADGTFLLLSPRASCLLLWARWIPCHALRGMFSAEEILGARRHTLAQRRSGAVACHRTQDFKCTAYVPQPSMTILRKNLLYHLLDPRVLIHCVIANPRSLRQETTCSGRAFMRLFGATDKQSKSTG